MLLGGAYSGHEKRAMIWKEARRRGKAKIKEAVADDD